LGQADVCAVVVAYHPDGDVLDNLSTLRRQLETIVVVDNGSNKDEVLALRERCISLGAMLIENNENLGIARALNQGIEAARAIHSEWVFLFDQDSRVTEGFVDTMMRGFAESPFGERLAILNPRYVDSRLGNDLLQHRQLRDGSLEAPTTSGSLTPMHVYRETGLFAEELFIDGVDYEYGLRVRSMNYFVATCNEAVLLHSPGAPVRHRLLGLMTFTSSNYSAVRRYYQERNKIWNLRRYGRRYPGFFVYQFYISLKELTKILLADENRWRKVRFFFRGYLDGLRNRMGRLD
jgi:rhamnosyltransferase